MPKHRSTVYTVVREGRSLYKEHPIWEFSVLVGTYTTISRAEEVCGASTQVLLDSGMSPTDPDYRFTVTPSTFYDE